MPGAGLGIGRSWPFPRRVCNLLPAFWLLVFALPSLAAAGPDDAFQRGMDLARQGRLEAARAEFQAGAQAYPADSRFPLELAGIAFKRNEFGLSKRYLRHALRLDPRNAYAHEFLASLYVLDGNLAAALKYWNPIGKPRIESIVLSPEPRLDPVLLDRALLFAPASTLTLHDYEGTLARLRQLSVFPRIRAELVPQAGDAFDLHLHTLERNGWGGSAPQSLVSLLRGVGFQTVFPEYFNIGRRAINFESLLRWDTQKQRLRFRLSGPVSNEARLRRYISFDARRENWDISQTFRSPQQPVDNLALRRLSGQAGFTAAATSRLSLWTAFELSWRSLPNRARYALGADPLFASGYAPALHAGSDFALLRLPERRLAVNAKSSIEAGKLLGRGLDPYIRAQASLESKLFPKARGDDYAMTTLVHAGSLTGDAPFDALTMLGLERDNDLWLRGHVGTANGRKGASPLGRDYFLLNWEMDKMLHQGSFWSIAAGPLLDTGSIRDSRSGFGAQKWLTDTGIQSKLRILSGPALVFTWGKDLRTGRNSFYASLER